MLYEGLQVDYIKIAKSVLNVRGIKYYGEGDTVSITEKAIRDILNGFKVLNQEYYGCKNYGSFICQGVSCKYGYSPCHGSIVFEIGLKEEYRRKAEAITNDQINACIYYLRHLDRIKMI